MTGTRTEPPSPVGRLPAWGNGIVIAIGVIGAVLAVGIDLFLADSGGHLVLMAFTGLAMSAGLLLSWWAPVPGAAMAMGSSVAGSIVTNFAAGRDPYFIYTPGAYESFILIALAYVVVMKASPFWGGLTVVGLVITSVFSWGLALQTQPILWTFAPIPVLVVAGIAGMIRFGTWQRGRDVVDARNLERLDLARELHDVIAHHMTGIVIQAQAGQMVARTDPEKAVATFDAIEQAGAGALASMRQLVANLREGSDVAPTTTDAADEIRELTTGFGLPGVEVDLQLAPFPPELGPTLVRLTREALTNVVRHATNVTKVEVAVIDEGQALRWSVRDNGTTSGSSAQVDSGFGLVGMRERVEALGGRFNAGPGSVGWAVEAVLPKRVTRV
ncbi:MAG: sensor histidine kinase [Acidimicrobiia bacterium]